MKKLLTIAFLSAVATTAMAVPSSMQPPLTGGVTNGSTAEVRITANVVDGIAVNEASPIDFGNLARGMYDGIVNQVTPGRIHVKAGSSVAAVSAKLSKATTDLIWTGANGTDQAGEAAATKTTITGVNISGLGEAAEDIPLTNGEATKVLTASFLAANTGDTANLGPKQKLGSYVGTVLVTAVKK